MDIHSTINIPVEVLGLSDITIESVNFNADREIMIRATSTRQELLCRQCHRPTEPHGCGRELMLRHLPVFGKPTYIVLIPRRGICQHCDNHPTTTECLDWYDANSKYTKPYEQHLLFELINSTVADVSAKEGVDYHSIEALIDKYIEQKIDFSTIQSLGAIGLDEISLKKGHRDFVTLVTYRHEKQVRLLAVLEGRQKATLEAFFRQIPRRLKKTITAICCDLYDGYIQAAKAVFKNKVPVIADRFHVSTLYRRSLITLRKAELRRLKRQLSIEAYQQLKPAIALLKKQKDYFSEEESKILIPLFAYSPSLKLAYQFSHQLTSLFNMNLTKQQAREKTMEWLAEVTASKLMCFNRFIKTLNKYFDEITNYFIAKNNSGFVEGFNNKVKVLKRRCYGLRSSARLFQRIILDTLGFERFAPDIAYG